MNYNSEQAFKNHFSNKGFYINDEDILRIEEIVEADKTIGWSGSSNNLYFDLRDGTQISLNRVDSAFVETMRTFPVEFKIRAMDLTFDDMANYMEIVKKELITELKKVFTSKKIKWKESGEKADYSDGFINKENFGLDKELTGKEIIKAVIKGEISISKGLNIFHIVTEETYF